MGDIRRKVLVICVGTICLFLDPIVTLGAEAGSGAPSAPQGTTKTANLELRSSEARLEIVITGNTLHEVLRDIEKLSGIAFDISPRVTEEVTIRMVMASNWQEVIRKLLQHANWVGISGKDGTLRQVIVLGQSERSSQAARRRFRAPSARSNISTARD